MIKARANPELQTRDTSQLVAVTLLRSPIGEKPKTRGTIRALGLRTIGDTRVHINGPVVEGMIRGAGRLVRVDLLKGSVEPLSEPFPTRPIEMDYALEGGSRGMFKVRDGEVFRVELRETTKSRAVSWSTNGCASNFFKAMYDAGGPDCQVSIVKETVIVDLRPWQPAYPDAILSSSSKVLLLRVQKNGESMVWERQRGERLPFDGELWIQLAAGQRSTFMGFARTTKANGWVEHVEKILEGGPF